MSHQVLARKWRPREFASLAGQEHVVRALKHALQTGRIHHAYLFTGTRGVGKTTIARILAKALNCETGVGPTPCGHCRACAEIDGGRFPDYVEMDAASNRGVDEMAQLLDAAAYAPVAGRTKVYVIDEVHMLSTHAFNAMLKTLEEPPSHVVFVLATTDPQKVPVTVLSRCLQFALKNMPPATVAARLREVLQAEAIAFEPEALDEIGHAAAGSMRDALSLLDQAIAHGAGQVRAESVREMLGAVDRGEIVALAEALADGDGAALIARADALCARGIPPERALQALAALVHRAALAQVGAVSADEAGSAQAAALAARVAPEDLQVWWQAAVHGVRDLPWAPDSASGFTMALLRMLAFRPDTVAAPPPAPPRPPVVRPPVPGAARPAIADVRPGQAVAGRGPAPVARPQGVPPALAERSIAPATSAASAASAHGGGFPGFDGDWPALARALPVTGIARQCVDRCALVSHDDEGFTLRVPIRAMAEPSVVAKVRDALAARFARALRLSIGVGDVSGPTVAAIVSAEQAERLAGAQAAIDDDPFVRSLIDEFGARILPGSVQPLTEPPPAPPGEAPER